MSNLSTYLLTIEECYTLNQRLLDIFAADLPATDVSMNKVIPFLTKIDDDLAAIVAKERKNAFTRQIAEKDELRDKAFTAFRDFCEVFTKSPKPVELRAAEKLVELIRRFGWSLQSESYVEQTALQQGLIEALDTPEYMAAIQTIRAVSWVDNMKAANEAFEQVVKLRDEQSGKEDVPLSKETKKELQVYLDPLLSFIGLMAKIEPQTYATLQSKVDEIVGNIMTFARSRKTRKGNQVDEAEGPEGIEA